MPFIRVTLLLILLSATACSFGGGTRSLEELRGGLASEKDYYVKSGDVLNIDVWGEPRVSGDVTVRQDGKLAVPLIRDIDAEDKSLEQIANEINVRLQEFIPGAAATVTVSQTAPIRFYLSGTFMKAGEYLSDSRVTLLQAVAKGGGFAPFADMGNMLLIRKGATGELRYRLDYGKVIDGREPNPELRNGDIIAVK